MWRRDPDCRALSDSMRWLVKSFALYACAVLVLAGLCAVSPAAAVAEGGPVLMASGYGAGVPSELCDMEVVSCPHCGRTVTAGSHALSVHGRTCPYCGKGRCPPEEKDELGAGVDLGFFSKYVSRGVTLTDDPVVQPNVWISYAGFTLGAWGNADTTDINTNEWEFNELDFTLDYTGRLQDFEYSVGGIYYVFPNTGGDDTAELYAAATYDVLLAPTLTVFYDFLDADGVYATLGVSHCFELALPTDMVSVELELSAQVGWGSSGFNEFNSGSYHNTFTDAVMTAELPICIGENISLTPMVSYSTALDRTIRTKNNGNDRLVWGLTVSGSI